MKILEPLKTMWVPRRKRKLKMIAPVINLPNGGFELDNKDWAFNVPYAFRDALDMRYEQRMKKKKPYMAWTQGTAISFKSGDTLTAKDIKRTVQVKFANGMGWDSDKDHMYLGSVTFDLFNIDNDLTPIFINRYRCDQMVFLTMLISGEIDPKHVIEIV